jgi:hypothetical protein
MNANIKSGPLTIEGIFLAACLWREKGFGRSISLPFWSATAYQHHRLSSAVGVPWLIVFLECVAEAADVARQQLDALRLIEEKAAVATSRAGARALGRKCASTRGRNL